MKKSFWLTIIILLLAIVYLKFYTTIEAVPLAADIEGFPKQVGSFTMTGSSEFSAEVLEKLGVSNYINRNYRDEAGYQLSLYLGYYEEQREGLMIHSPKNCMPGSGWVPVDSSVVTVSSSNSNEKYQVNRILFQKGMDKLIMHYWYQGRNRIVANEYIDRILLIMDSLLKHRSEGALVRVLGPWDPGGKFERKQEEFIASLLPALQQIFPK